MSQSPFQAQHTSPVLQKELLSIPSLLASSNFTSGQGQQRNNTNASLYAGWGVKCCQGVSKKMEDTYCVHEHQQVKAPLVSNSGNPTNPTGTFEDFALFSAFDGHGGEEVAKHCAMVLHQHFINQLSTLRLPSLASELSLHESHSLSAFFSPPESPITPCTTPGHIGAGPVRPLTPAPAPAASVAEALRASFLATDQDLAGTETGDYTGSTGVAVVLTRDHIVVAHCGDSRAVLQRNGSTFGLTSDHKPSRDDEAARIRAAGGRIVYNSGAPRVMGMLAMTRCIGDHYLRPYIIADPEVMCMERCAEDEVLLVATDGLWDMFTDVEATNLASRCIMRCKERGMSKHGACRVASNVLVKAAMERGSRDNITVLVVLLAAGELVVPGGTAGKQGAQKGLGCAGPAASDVEVLVAEVGRGLEEEGEAACSPSCGIVQQQQQQQSPCTVCCECFVDSSSGACSDDAGDEWEEPGQERGRCSSPSRGDWKGKGGTEGPVEEQLRQLQLNEETGDVEDEGLGDAELLGSSAPVCSSASGMEARRSLGGLAPRLSSLSMGVPGAGTPAPAQPPRSADAEVHAHLDLAADREQRKAGAGAGAGGWPTLSIP